MSFGDCMMKCMATVPITCGNERERMVKADRVRSVRRGPDQLNTWPDHRARGGRCERRWRWRYCGQRWTGSSLLSDRFVWQGKKEKEPRRLTGREKWVERSGKYFWKSNRGASDDGEGRRVTLTNWSLVPSLRLIKCLDARRRRPNQSYDRLIKKK